MLFNIPRLAFAACWSALTSAKKVTHITVGRISVMRNADIYQMLRFAASGKHSWFDIWLIDNSNHFAFVDGFLQLEKILVIHANK